MISPTRRPFSSHPLWLRREWFPRLKRLNDAWHSRDVYCLFHSDGHLWAVLDDLIAAGIDGLNPLEVQAGMTVREVRQRYPQLFLTGGIDVSQLLPLGTPDQVRAAAIENIAGHPRPAVISSARPRSYTGRSQRPISWPCSRQRGAASKNHPTREGRWGVTKGEGPPRLSWDWGGRHPRGTLRCSSYHKSSCLSLERC